MIVLPNMGLYQWNEVSDSFSHSQLAANFEALDNHDHTAGKGKQIPAGGLAPNSVKAENIQEGAFTASKLAEGSIETKYLKDKAVTSAKLETGAVTSEKILDGTVSDTDLASPNNLVWRTVHFGSGPYAASTAGTKYFQNNGATLGAATGTTVRSIFFVPGDYTVAGKTAKLRIRAQQRTVATGPGTTLTVGMYKVTAIAANTLTVEASAVTGSTVAFASTAANTLAQANSGAFAVPAEGHYIWGVANSGTTAASSEHGLSFQLQLRFE